MKSTQHMSIFLSFDKYKVSMRPLLGSKRSRAILGIGIVAIGIGAIFKKVISYPAGGCMKDFQEMTFKKEINKYFI